MGNSTIFTKKRKRDAVERAIKSYYSGLSEQALDEDKKWAEFSLIQFLKGETNWLPLGK
jgi:hypothetical protein